MYTAVLRHLLGLRPQGESMTLEPRLPGDWPGFTLDITLRDTPLHIDATRLPLTAAEGERGLFDGTGGPREGDTARREEASDRASPAAPRLKPPFLFAGKSGILESM